MKQVLLGVAVAWAVVYFSIAFIFNDLWWMRDIMEWTPGFRALFLWLSVATAAGGALSGNEWR